MTPLLEEIIELRKKYFRDKEYNKREFKDGAILTANELNKILIVMLELKDSKG